MILRESQQFNDIDLFAESMINLEQSAVQLKGRTFKFSNDQIYLPNMTLGRININKHALFYGVCNKDYLAMIISRNKGEIRVNGKTINSYDSLFLIPPSEEIVALYETPVEGYYISINKDYLIKNIGLDLYSLLLSKPDLVRTGKFNLDSLNYFKENLFKFLEFALQNSNCLSDITVKDIQYNVVDLVRVFFDNIYDDLERAVPLLNNRYEVVRRALDYINSSNDIYISIPNLAEICFCSVRTLEYSFKAILSVTPKKYLIARRMHLIRCDLLYNNNESISNIINKYGIVNPGRFSSDYFKMYGEYPKNTLKGK